MAIWEQNEYPIPLLFAFQETEFLNELKEYKLILEQVQAGVKA